MRRAEHVALRDILQAIDRATGIVKGVDRKVYEVDYRVHMVVERCVEIVSEASRRVSPSSKDAFPDVPWHAIEAIGNKLRHEYGRVDPDIMWSVVTVWLPQLRTVVSTLLEK